MIVILNNGTRIKADKETIQAIFQNIIKGEAKQWQCQSDPQRNALSGYNLSQVAAIVKEEDVIGGGQDALEQIGLFLDTLAVHDEHGRFWAEKFRRFVLDKKSTL